MVAFITALLLTTLSVSSSLRIIQYNAEWLFTEYYEPMDCPGNGCTWKNLSHAQSHLNIFASRLGPLGGDIINICEVQGVSELSEVIDAIDYSSSYTPYLVQGTDTGTGQNVGMISNFPPTQSLWRTNITMAYPIPDSTCGYSGEESHTSVSKHYVTSFNIVAKDEELYVLTIISAHLIAIPNDVTRCAKREAQASILQVLIYDAIQDGNEVLVIGDLNDYDNITKDVSENTPISSTLEILKGNAGKYKNKYSLTNLAGHISQEHRYSDWWDSDSNCNTASDADYSMIDHVLVTPNIEKLVTSMFILHSYDEYCGKMDSDHYPVIIDLDTTIV